MEAPAEYDSLFNPMLISCYVDVKFIVHIE
jgi:hypothetical protein